MSSADVQHGGSGPGRPADRSWLRLARETNNPLLRRPTSRERLARQIGVFLLAVTAVVALTASVLVYRAGTAAERADAGRRPVSVTVLRQLEPTTASNAYASQVRLEVRYQFDGVDRVSTMPTLFGAVTGAQIDAWTDAQGELVSPPQTAMATLAQTALTVLGSLMLVLSLAFAGRAGLAAWSMRHRMREWEQEWLAFDRGRIH
jgi:hypothetical protein